MFVLRGRIGALHQQMKLEQLFNNIGHDKNMSKKYYPTTKNAKILNHRN